MNKRNGMLLALCCAITLVVVGCSDDGTDTYKWDTKTTEATPAACVDGIDNDGNGLTDCQDYACKLIPAACPSIKTDAGTPAPKTDAGVPTPVKIDKCGNSTVDGKEMCDTAITSGGGMCPTQATCFSKDTLCTKHQFAGAACSAQCVQYNLPLNTPCSLGMVCNGKGSCILDPNTKSEPAKCGNSSVDQGETCDTGITIGSGVCDTAATCYAKTKNTVCTSYQLGGSGCTAACVLFAKTVGVSCGTNMECDGNGGCKYVAEKKTCGNGSLENSEKCDPNIKSGTGVCETAITCGKKSSVCRTYKLGGSAAQCNAECVEFDRVKGFICSSGMECNGKGKCVLAPTINPCGNGSLDLSEECDISIPAGSIGACHTTTTCAKQTTKCTQYQISGKLCQAKCLSYNNPKNTVCASGMICDGNGGCVLAPTINSCGNGSLDLSEECDISMPAGSIGACDTAVSCGKKNTSCTHHVFTGKLCDTKCTPVNDKLGTPCGSGLICSGSGLCQSSPTTPSCGNGALDVNKGENCDTGIKAGQLGACPTSCNDQNECTYDVLEGVAVICKAACKFTNKTNGTPCSGGTCQNGTCTAPLCGNGNLESGEKCDTAIPANKTGVCPTTAGCAVKDCYVPYLDGAGCQQMCAYLKAPAGSSCNSGKGTCNSLNKCIANPGTTPVTCGDGKLEPVTEKCDTAIAISLVGACPINNSECPQMECAHHYVYNTGNDACQVDCSGMIPVKKGVACTGGTCDGKGGCTPTPTVVKCGDKTCHATESCTSCPTDCGVCPTTASSATIRVTCPTVAYVHVYHAADPNASYKGGDSYGPTSSTSPYSASVTVNQTQGCQWGISAKNQVPVPDPITKKWKWFGESGAPTMSTCTYAIRPFGATVFTTVTGVLKVYPYTNSEGNLTFSKSQLGCPTTTTTP